MRKWLVLLIFLSLALPVWAATELTTGEAIAANAVVEINLSTGLLEEADATTDTVAGVAIEACASGARCAFETGDVIQVLVPTSTPADRWLGPSATNGVAAAYSTRTDGGFGYTYTAESSGTAWMIFYRIDQSGAVTAVPADDQSIIRANGTAGQIEGSGVFIDDSDNVTGIAQINISGDMSDGTNALSVQEARAAFDISVALNTVVTGLSVSWSGSGLIFDVAAGTYFIRGTSYTYAGGQVTLATADGSNDRIDVIVVNTSSATTSVTGVASGSPVKPSVDDLTQIGLTFVTIPTGSSTPSVTVEDIYLESTEWTDVASDASHDLTSAVDPDTGSVSIEATGAASGDYVTFTSTNFDLTDFTTLRFRLNSKATWANAKSIELGWFNDSVQVGSSVVLDDGLYGWDSSSTGAYQTITINMGAFALPSQTIDYFAWVVQGGGGAIGYFLDNIEIQTGVPVGTPSDAFITFNADTGTTTADSPVDELTIAGGDLIATSIAGDTVTVALAGSFASLGSVLTGTLLPADGGLGTDPEAFVDGLIGVASSAVANINTLAELNTAISSGLVTGAHFATEDAQDAYGALLSDPDSSESGIREDYDDANNALDNTVIIDGLQRTWFTTEAVTEGSTRVNLTMPSVTLGHVTSCECNEWKNVSFTVTPTDPGGADVTEVNVTLYLLDTAGGNVATWVAWDPSTGALVDGGYFHYKDGDSTQELHITIVEQDGTTSYTYTVTVDGTCVAKAWSCPA